VTQFLPVDPSPGPWPGSSLDDFRTGPDGRPARVVKAHNVHKAHYIKQYAHTVAVAMKKWPYRAYIDTYAGPGLCWVEDSGEFVQGSPLIAAAADPPFTHTVLVDLDPRCTNALRERLGPGPIIRCGDSNAVEVIDAIRGAIPGHDCLSLALLDPQGCTLHLETIRRLSDGMPMDLLINLPIHSLLRCLRKGDRHVLDAVLGPGWPDLAKLGVPAWRAAVRDHYREKL
jgi:three-Cys-motif partner protein